MKIKLGSQAQYLNGEMGTITDFKDGMYTFKLTEGNTPRTVYIPEANVERVLNPKEIPKVLHPWYKRFKRRLK